MTHERQVATRQAHEGDREFLSAVYAASRAEELAAVPWSDEQKATFLAQQFGAQDSAYRTMYPDADFSVIESDGEPIGRMYVTRLGSDEVRLIDLALLPPHRGSGIGSSLLTALIETADREGRFVSLHVEHWNRAVALYTRLGFVDISSNDVYVRMERARRGVS